MGIQVGAGISATANTFAINILEHIVSRPCAGDCFVYMASFFGNQQYSTLSQRNICEKHNEDKSSVLFISVGVKK